mgnify:CR=1 FL=1
MITRVELELWHRNPVTGAFLRKLADRFPVRWLNLQTVEDLKLAQGHSQVLEWVRAYLDGEYLD